MTCEGRTCQTFMLCACARALPNFREYKSPIKGDTIQAAACLKSFGGQTHSWHIPLSQKRHPPPASRFRPPSRGSPPTRDARAARPRTTVLAFGASRARREQRAQADFAELAPRKIWSGTWDAGAFEASGKRGVGHEGLVFFPFFSGPC